LWSDQAAAINDYLGHRAGPAAETAARTDVVEAYRTILVERTARGDIRPWQFWRTMGARAFLRERAPDAQGQYDDPGRALLLGLGFRLLGGIAPYLILWVGAIACAPLVAWLLWESFAARRARAGTVFVLCLVCSPYFVESLALSRYAVGFYLAALLALAAVGFHVLRPAVTVRGLAWRAIGAGCTLAVCALCRSSVLLLLPAFVAALALGAWRAVPQRRRAALAALGLAAAVGAPYLAVRQPEHHGLWSALWEGLGDFDREKGHAWSDPVAEQASLAAGGGPLFTASSEAAFKRLVLKAMADDPLWYAGILARRMGATLTQWKLWPWRPRDGTPVRPRTSANEGFIDKYYGYTTTVDHVALGTWRAELPIALLLLPAVALAVVAVARRGGAGRAAREGLLLMGLFALATLPVPVLISTAAAQETQAFALAFFLGLGFLAEQVRIRERPPGS
jgi:hypothetical protein